MTQAEIQRIDDLQLLHSQLFDEIDVLEGYKKPKHHFFTHLVVDIWRYGPLRGVWTFGFESFNKIIKKGAQMSGYKSESVSIMRYWSMRSAKWLVSPDAE
jgi:hypothetical protein